MWLISFWPFNYVILTRNHYSLFIIRYLLFALFIYYLYYFCYFCYLENARKALWYFDFRVAGLRETAFILNSYLHFYNYHCPVLRKSLDDCLFYFRWFLVEVMSNPVILLFDIWIISFDSSVVQPFTWTQSLAMFQKYHHRQWLWKWWQYE